VTCWGTRKTTKSSKRFSLAVRDQKNNPTNTHFIKYFDFLMRPDGTMVAKLLAGNYDTCGTPRF